jgi:hypothetical protein
MGGCAAYMRIAFVIVEAESNEHISERCLHVKMILDRRSTSDVDEKNQCELSDHSGSACPLWQRKHSTDIINGPLVAVVVVICDVTLIQKEYINREVAACRDWP